MNNIDFNELMDFPEENLPFSEENLPFSEEKKLHFVYENDIKVHNVIFPKDFQRKNLFLSDFEEHFGENPLENKELSKLSIIKNEENKQNSSFFKNSFGIFSENLKKNKKDLEVLKNFKPKLPKNEDFHLIFPRKFDDLFEVFLSKMSSEKSRNSFSLIVKQLLKKFSDEELMKFSEFYEEKLPPMILQRKEDPLKKELISKDFIEKEKILNEELQRKIEEKMLEKKNTQVLQGKIEEISGIYKEICEELMKKKGFKQDIIKEIEEIQLENQQFEVEIGFFKENAKKQRVLVVGYEILQINQRKYEGFLKKIVLNLEEIMRKLKEKTIPGLKSVIFEENSKRILALKLEKTVILEKNKRFIEEKELLKAKNEVSCLEKEVLLLQNDRKSLKSRINGLISENMDLYIEEKEKFNKEKPEKKPCKAFGFLCDISALKEEENRLLYEKSSLSAKILQNSLNKQEFTHLISQKSSFLCYLSKHSMNIMKPFPLVSSKKPSMNIMNPFPYILLCFLIILKLFFLKFF